jgi:hypothetical protein
MNQTDFCLDDLFLSDCLMRGATSRDLVTMKLAVPENPRENEAPREERS